MSEEVTNTAQTTPEPATPAEALNTETPETTNEVMIPKSRFDEVNKRLKAIEREAEQQRKAADEAARKQAEEQGEFKKLYEKAQAELEAANQRAKAVELARLKDRISAKHQLPAALADRLRGETEEELEADAKALLEAMPKPVVPAANDASSGINSAPPKSGLTEEAIREMAAVYGVTVQGLKKSLGVIE